MLGFYVLVSIMVILHRGATLEPENFNKAEAPGLFEDGQAETAKDLVAKDRLASYSGRRREVRNANAEFPKCTTRVSSISGTGDDDLASVSCEGDEVMTGCTSYLPGTAHGTRDGEYIKLVGGNATCFAQNGFGGTGVEAYARCCVWPGMECRYASGPRSGSNDDDFSSYSCTGKINNNPLLLTDCMARSFWQNLDGAHPVTGGKQTTLEKIANEECRAYNGFGGEGTDAFAACCSAERLVCKAKWSTPSEGSVGSTATVDCDDGWILTGCSVFTYWKETDGAYISAGDSCIAVNGGNAFKVWAVATCCRGGCKSIGGKCREECNAKRGSVPKPEGICKSPKRICCTKPNGQ